MRPRHPAKNPACQPMRQLALALAFAFTLGGMPAEARTPSTKEQAKATKFRSHSSAAAKKHVAVIKRSVKAKVAKSRPQPSPSMARSEPRQRAAGKRLVSVREIRFSGNERFTAAQLLHALGHPGAMPLSLGEVQKLAMRVGEYYGAHGYRAHAYSRPEGLATGYLEFVVVEAAEPPLRAPMQRPQFEPPLRIDRGLLLTSHPGWTSPAYTTAAAAPGIPGPLRTAALTSSP